MRLIPLSKCLSVRIIAIYALLQVTTTRVQPDLVGRGHCLIKQFEEGKTISEN